MEKGYIKLYRALQDNPLWREETFTRGQAWVDLLMLANYKDAHIRVRGNKIAVKRGQVGWSVQRLAERWGWSRGKVQRFLDELEDEQQIEQQKNNVTSLITITKYEHYQGETDTRPGSRRTPDGQQTDTNNKGKKEKKKSSGDEQGLPEWLDSDLWEDFREHRKELKSPMTARAEQMALKKLEQFRHEGQDPSAVIERAIENGWKGLFPAEQKRPTEDDVFAGAI